ncbi:MAG: heme exporter protein CcmD [Maricaulaceae bacterium]|jgi:heme exporter protein CcmD
MTDAATFDAAPFILAAYGLMAVVVGGAIAATLLEGRYWARRARAIEKTEAPRENQTTAASSDAETQTN